jgi:hypothetical protein
MIADAEAYWFSTGAGVSPLFSSTSARLNTLVLRRSRLPKCSFLSVPCSAHGTVESVRRLQLLHDRLVVRHPEPWPVHKHRRDVLKRRGAPGVCDAGGGQCWRCCQRPHPPSRAVLNRFCPRWRPAGLRSLSTASRKVSDCRPVTLVQLIIGDCSCRRQARRAGGFRTDAGHS